VLFSNTVDGQLGHFDAAIENPPVLHDLVLPEGYLIDDFLSIKMTPATCKTIRIFERQRLEAQGNRPKIAHFMAKPFNLVARRNPDVGLLACYGGSQVTIPLVWPAYN
jgi:hypothetical protein